jgi:hypothetical protein
MQYSFCSAHVEGVTFRLLYEGVSKSFRTESITKYKPTTTNTRWEAIQRVMAAKLIRLTHKIAIQLHLVAESCTIWSSRSRRLVRKRLDTPSYLKMWRWKVHEECGTSVRCLLMWKVVTCSRFFVQILEVTLRCIWVALRNSHCTSVKWSVFLLFTTVHENVCLWNVQV